MRVTGALFLAGAGLALSTWAAVACTTADVRFSDFQFRRVSVTGVAITGEVINDCAEPVWGIIRLSFRNKRGVVDTKPSGLPDGTRSRPSRPIRFPGTLTSTRPGRHWSIKL